MLGLVGDMEYPYILLSPLSNLNITAWQLVKLQGSTQ
jgi:hypothetical protein